MSTEVAEQEKSSVIEEVSHDDFDWYSLVLEKSSLIKESLRRIYLNAVYMGSSVIKEYRVYLCKNGIVVRVEKQNYEPPNSILIGSVCPQPKAILHFADKGICSKFLFKDYLNYVEECRENNYDPELMRSLMRINSEAGGAFANYCEKFAYLFVTEALSNINSKFVSCEKITLS